MNIFILIKELNKNYERINSYHSCKKRSRVITNFLERTTEFKLQKNDSFTKEDYETKKSLKDFTDIKIHEQINNGYGNALIEGINNCETEYCCIINADGSMDPKYLKDMMELCKGNDLIYGSRYQKPGGGSEDDDIITLVGNFFLHF